MITPEFSTQFEQFSARVLADAALQDRLRQPGDIDDFIALAVQAGAIQLERRRKSLSDIYGCGWVQSRRRILSGWHVYGSEFGDRASEWQRNRLAHNSRRR